jgi:SAM-dependent methyltransferase
MPPRSAAAPHYVYDQAWERERERLRALEQSFDDVSRGRLERLGVGPGWHCLEVGGGAGSIARWLAEEVGPGGHVVVTDLDTRFLEDLRSPSVEVRRHDIVRDQLEPDTYDLIHLRAVLEYVPERGPVVARLARALRPGGWLVLEGLDIDDLASRGLERYTSPPELAPLVTRALDAFGALVRTAGGDAQCASTFVALLRESDLEDVDAELVCRLVPGNSPRAAFYLLSLRHLREKLAATGRTTDAEVDAAIAHLEGSGSQLMSMAAAGAWGRRPSS